MTLIKPYGAFFKNDVQGQIMNMTHHDLIHPPWSKVLSVIETAYLEMYQNHIHSIYLRGSVPRGLAVEGVSDVDSFAILKPGSESIKDIQAENRAEKELGQQFPFTPRVEFYTLPYIKVDSPSSVQRFIIKVNSLCIWGHNLCEDISPYKPGKAIAFFAQHYANQLAQFQQQFLTFISTAQLEASCAWIMKRTVRSGFDLVMEQFGKYTRDLYPCYQGFIEQYPKQKTQMYQALEWAITPISDVNAITAFVETFCVWLRDQIEAYLD